MFKIICLFLLLFNIANADVLVGNSATATNPRVYSLPNTGFYTDSTNLLSSIAGTSITKTSATGFISNLNLNTLGGACITTTAGLCLSYTSTVGTINVPTGNSLSYSVNGTSMGSIDQWGHNFRPASGIPTIGTCGTANIAANSVDNSLILNITAGTPSTCTINFAHAMPTGTICTYSPGAASSTSVSYISNTTTVITLTGTSMVGTYNILCL